jgi:DNA polymerase
MNKLYLDFETRSLADLKAVGAAKYAADPSTDVLCIGAMLEEKSESFIVVPDELKKSGKQETLFMSAKDPKILFISHGIFDQFIWQSVMVKKYGYPEIPIERFRCTMAKCYAHGLSGSLKEAAIALNLPIRKDMEGRDNMLSLSKPRKNGTFWTPQDKPESFKKLYEYCKTDVEVMRLIDETLPDLSPKEQKIWFIDQRINQEGIKVDIDAIRKSIVFSSQDDERKQTIFKGITNGIPSDSRQRAKLLTWLNKRGIALENTQKSTITHYLATESDIPSDVAIVLETCLSGGKTSLAKYSKMLERADENGQIREILQYHGAHTGRWAGRGIQIQNFPRETYDSDNVLDVLNTEDAELFGIFYSDQALALSSMLRKVIIAPTGCTFYGADFSQIEARVLAWLAGQKSKLEAYERGEDLYLKTASEIFGVKIEKEDKAERQVGKVAELALGFGGGIGAFITMSTAYNLDISQLYESMWKKANNWEKQQAEVSYQRYLKNGNYIAPVIGLTADLIKQRWRNANKAIVDYWERVEGAARMAIKNEGLSIKQLYSVNRLGNGTRFLQCRLPSGRIFSYLNPSLGSSSATYTGKPGEVIFNIGSNPNSINFDKPKYGRSSTYGGELVENIVQAVSRDILAEAMVRLDENYPAAFTIHDEVVSVPKENNTRSYREFERIMREVPVWAKGLPIDVECWEGRRYGK